MERKTYNYEELLAHAILLASRGHEGQYDKLGTAYILHPLTLMFRLAPNRKAMIVAVLHDYKEDCEEAGSEDLSMFPPDILFALDCLTHREGETYWEYLERVLLSPLAMLVKREDLIHNLDASRMPNPLKDKDFRRWMKYRQALEVVNAALEPA